MLIQTENLEAFEQNNGIKNYILKLKKEKHTQFLNDEVIVCWYFPNDQTLHLNSIHMEQTTMKEIIQITDYINKIQ